MPAMSSREWAMLLALSALWGGSFFFVGVAVHEFPFVTLVFLRVAIAAPVLILVVRFTGQRVPRDARAYLLFAAMGLCNNVIPFLLFAWAQNYISSGLASILNATTPLFTVLLAHLVTRDERLTSGKLVGVALGFAEVVVMIGPAAFLDAAVSVLAQLACLGAAFLYAVATILGRRFRTMGIAPTVAAAGQISASALILLPAALLVDRIWTLPIPGWPAAGAVLGSGLLSTAIAYLLYFRILATAGATNLLLVTFLMPIGALILGTLVLKEPLVASQLLGMVVIGLGLAAIDGRLPRLALDLWRGREWRTADGK